MKLCGCAASMSRYDISSGAYNNRQDRARRGNNIGAAVRAELGLQRALQLARREMTERF